MALDKLMEELGITFAYVSEFLRKVVAPGGRGGAVGVRRVQGQGSRRGRGRHAPEGRAGLP